MFVQFVFVNLFPLYSDRWCYVGDYNYAGTLLSSNKGFLVNLILQTSPDCLLMLFILISHMHQLVSVNSLLF